jgi:hypothetical protein
MPVAKRRGVFLVSLYGDAGWQIQRPLTDGGN